MPLTIRSLQKLKGIINWQNNLTPLLQTQEFAYKMYSTGQLFTPAPLLLDFADTQQSDCHIKGGALKGSPYFFTKIASSSYSEEKANSDGCYIVGQKSNGQLLEIWHDHGWFTRLRTALAGVLMVKFFSGKDEAPVGIIGTGQQAFFQSRILRFLYPNRTLYIWGRHPGKTQSLCHDIGGETYSLTDLETFFKKVNIAITLTSSKKPFIEAHFLPPSLKALICMGSDAPEKREIHADVYSKAQHILVDSISNIKKTGDFSEALQHDPYLLNRVVEVGEYKQKKSSEAPGLSMVDLIGLGAQDVTLGEWVYQRLLES